MITMNKKTLSRALLSATILASGVVGAGSVIAQASDGNDEPASTIDSPEPTAPNALQTIDPQPDDVATTDPNPEAADAPATRSGRGCGGNEAVAEVLGLTTDQLHEARDSGSSLAEIATSQGVAVEDVVQAIVDNKADRLDEKVAAGELTAEEAQERLAAAEARADDRVNGNRSTASA
jgi:hypothetical protein